MTCKWCLKPVEKGTRHKPTGPCEDCETVIITPRKPLADLKAQYPEAFESDEE